MSGRVLPAVVVAVLSLLYVGIIVASAPSHWESRCVASHEVTELQIYPAGDGNVMLMPVRRTVCDRRVDVRVKGWAHG